MSAPQPQARYVLTEERFCSVLRDTKTGDTLTFQGAGEWPAVLLSALNGSAAPQPQPQASAEDVALVDEWMRDVTPPAEQAAWQRIRASLGVVK